MALQTRKLRIGFVGTGFMGQCAHLRNYATLDGCEIVALSELREDMGRRVAARYNIPKVYTQASAMLAAEKLDGIVASQQFNRHGIVVNELLPAGIPIFIEKPLAASLKVGEQLAAADQAAGGKVMVGYHKRSDPATIYAKAEIERLKQTGEIGKLQYIRITIPSGDFIANGVFDGLLGSDHPAPTDVDPQDPDLSEENNKAYFYFVNFFIHQLNLLRHLLGEDYKLSYVDPSNIVIVGHSLGAKIPVTLECIPYTTISDWEEVALVAFESGYLKLTLPAPLILNRAGEVEIVRDPKRGTAPAPALPPYPIHFQHPYPSLNESNWSAGSTFIPKMPHDHAMRVQAANFLRFCRGETPPPVGAAEALKDLQLGRDWLRMSKGV
jgi:predicted dehydrogenase